MGCPTSFETGHRIGLNATVTNPSPNSALLLIQHAGPILNGNAHSAVATAVHLAHRSRRLMIRTASQRQNAMNATPNVSSARAMPEFYPTGSENGKRTAPGHDDVVCCTQDSRQRERHVRTVARCEATGGFARWGGLGSTSTGSPRPTAITAKSAADGDATLFEWAWRF